MKKVLVIVTRIRDISVSEFEINWRRMDFFGTEEIKKNNEVIGKKVSNRDAILIVLDGVKFQIPAYSGTFYAKHKTPAKDLVEEVCKLIKDYDNSDKILLAIHWHDMRLERILEFVNKLFEELELLKEKKAVFDKAQIVSYGIGVSDKSKLPQIEQMVRSLQSNLSGFEEAFENLWGALKGSHEINFFLQTLLSKLKLEWYDLGKDRSRLSNDEAKKIVNTFWYLLKGTLKDNRSLPNSEGEIKEKTITRAIEILPYSDAVQRNVKNFIISDLSWKDKDDASKKLDEHLSKLDGFLTSEDLIKKDFISWCEDFSRFLSSITAGRKPYTDDGSKSLNQ